MATINIPDSMVPEGYELTGEFRLPRSGEYILDSGTGDGTVAHQAGFDYTRSVYPILRRKPRLKQIVFTVAGEPRAIQRGEWYISFGGSPLMGDSFTPTSPRTPLTREEVYE